MLAHNSSSTTGIGGYLGSQPRVQAELREHILQLLVVMVLLLKGVGGLGFWKGAGDRTSMAKRNIRCHRDSASE